jgi:hypothetical protein
MTMSDPTKAERIAAVKEWNKRDHERRQERQREREANDTKSDDKR